MPSVEHEGGRGLSRRVIAASTRFADAHRREGWTHHVAHGPVEHAGVGHGGLEQLSLGHRPDHLGQHHGRFVLHHRHLAHLELPQDLDGLPHGLVGMGVHERRQARSRPRSRSPTVGPAARRKP